MARRPALCCWLSGVLIWLGFPGPDLWWLTPWVGLVPLLAALPHLSPRRAALAAWAAGATCAGLTLLWLLGLIPIAGTVAALGFATLVPWLGAFWIPPALAARWTLRRWPAGLALVVPATWALAELLQNRLFTGFGWVLLGYTQGANLPLMQLASLGSVYAVTWVLVLANVAVAYLLLAPLPLSRRIGAAAGCAALVLLAHGWGARRAAQDMPLGEPVRVGVVQGAFATEVKWDYRYTELMWEQQTYQARRAVARGAEIVFWSESALGLDPFDRLEGRVVPFVRALGVPLVLGANYRHVGPADTETWTNAALAVDPDGTVLGPYDKRHLTPFGEYAPYGDVFPFIQNMIPVISDFTPGHAWLPLDVRGLRLQPLICFESVFPHDVRAAVRATDPVLLAHLTNVGWFGRTIMPEQDLVVARFRAVEAGVPMVRAANAGISCVIDPHGRVTDVVASPYGRVFIQGTLVADVRPGRVPTVYRAAGDAVLLVFVLLAGAGLAVCYTRRSRPT